MARMAAASKHHGVRHPLRTEGVHATLSRSFDVAAYAGLLHTDFMHLAGSLLPWAVLACILELNYGSVRVVVLWLISLLGAAFTLCSSGSALPSGEDQLT